METHSHYQEAYEKSRFKAFAIVIIILSVLTAAGVFAFRQLSRNQSGSPTLPTPAVTTTEPPTEEPTPIPGWETYENEEYNFTVQYPPEWERRNESQMFPNQTDLFSIHLFGETQTEGTEVYDGAIFSVGTPVATSQSASEYARETHSSDDPALSEPPVFSQEEINGVTYEKVYVCGLGCFTYYYTHNGGSLYRIVAFAEGPNKEHYDTQIQQMLASLSWNAQL